MASPESPCEAKGCWHSHCRTAEPTDAGPLLALLTLSLALTLAAVALSTTLAVAIRTRRAGARARRVVASRETEAGHVAALAQRWSRTPAVLGGPVLPGEGFGAVTFDTLGLARDARHASVRRTDIGTYQLLAVAPCAALDGLAATADTPPPAGGGLLVVGTCERPEGAVAVVVLGPLVQIRLPDVPWAWVRDLMTRAVTPTACLPAPVPAARPATGGRPRQRAMPSWRSPKPTRRQRTTDRPLA